MRSIAADAASSVVGICQAHRCPVQNGWTVGESVWGQTCVSPIKEPCTIDPDPPQKGAFFEIGTQRRGYYPHSGFVWMRCRSAAASERHMSGGKQQQQQQQQQRSCSDLSRCHGGNYPGDLLSDTPRSRPRRAVPPPPRGRLRHGRDAPCRRRLSSETRSPTSPTPRRTRRRPPASSPPPNKVHPHRHAIIPCLAGRARAETTGNEIVPKIKLYIGPSDVTESMATKRSSFCGYNVA